MGALKNQMIRDEWKNQGLDDRGFVDYEEYQASLFLGKVVMLLDGIRAAMNDVAVKASVDLMIDAFQRDTFDYRKGLAKQTENRIQSVNLDA